MLFRSDPVSLDFEGRSLFIAGDVLTYYGASYFCLFRKECSTYPKVKECCQDWELKSHGRLKTGPQSYESESRAPNDSCLVPAGASRVPLGYLHSTDYDGVRIASLPAMSLSKVN